ncbi:MAG: response regulator transcription factor [Oscillospiraceae bacterium]|nr:response regulator transcription factor [Oscillospiraceae bacterium]
MSYTALLVEDDAQIREIISDYFLGKEDIDIVTAADGGEGLDMIHEREFDVIMLDIMLPGADGFTLCREIRRKSDVPVLFLTARGGEEDIIRGYDLGCDDYIVKPFSLAALYGKLSALLKRSGSPSRTRLVCGRISLDTVTFTVTADGRETELPPKEYALLRYFMEHKGWVIDRNTLLDKVWGEDYFGSDRVVDNHIKKLRKALGSAGTQIKTVIGGGYKIQER